MNIAIIRYNAGNASSVFFSLQRLGYSGVITSDHSIIAGADKVIFPGVGEASTAMKFLNENGMDELITSLTQPVLGICLGMQLLCNHSEENNTACLGVFNTEVQRLGGGLKVPHAGWNSISGMNGPLFRDLPSIPYCYFVHGYAARICEHSSAITSYGREFSSALQKDNFYGVQFHPEKSAATGETILKNFITLS